MKIRKCFSVSSYSQIEKLLESKKTKTILIIYIKSNLIKGFGIDWLRVLINLIKKNYKQFKIKFYVDSGTDYGLSILIIRENIDYLKLRSNRIILNKFHLHDLF